MDLKLLLFCYDFTVMDKIESGYLYLEKNINFYVYVHFYVMCIDGYYFWGVNKIVIT